MARAALAVGLALLALPAPAAGAVQQPRAHYAAPVEGTDAFVAIVKKLDCFKAYLSDGTEHGATLSVWFQGCLDPDGRTLSATRGGVSLQAELTRRTAVGSVTLRDGRSYPFSVRSGDRGGLVGRRFVHEGRRYRSGWVVLRDNRVRWRIVPIGSGLYGEPASPLPSTGDACADARAERGLLRAQSGPLSRQSGIWELRMNRGRGPTAAQYNRLNQARSALEERIWTLDQRLYECG